MICLQSPGGRAEINNFETAHFNGAPFFNMVYMMNGFAFAKMRVYRQRRQERAALFFEINLRIK